MSNLKHGMKHTKVYGVWCAMIRRCGNCNSRQYKDYGGRGITVCARWIESFENFYADMGEPSPGMTLDRYPNNDGNYEPSNCRWATRTEQAANKRNLRLLTIEGNSRHIAEWSRLSGIKLATIWARIQKGWSPLDAVFKPLVPHKERAFGSERDVQWTPPKQ